MTENYQVYLIMSLKMKKVKPLKFILMRVRQYKYILEYKST